MEEQDFLVEGGELLKEILGLWSVPPDPPHHTAFTAISCLVTSAMNSQDWGLDFWGPMTPDSLTRSTIVALEDMELQILGLIEKTWSY